MGLQFVYDMGTHWKYLETIQMNTYNIFYCKALIFLHAGQFFILVMLFDGFFPIFFFKSFRNTIRVSNSLDPDQAGFKLFAKVISR